MRALIVDDDEDMQVLIRSSIELADLGLQVVGVAGSVADGEAQFWALRPDVVIVDYRMPDGNGVELVARLREDGAARPRVIFCSAAISGEIRRAMDDLEPLGVVEKDRFREIPQMMRDFAA